MAPTPTQTAEERLRPILDRVYRAFDAPAPRPPLLICNCNSCLTPQEQEEFCSYPLREIPASFLQAYLSSVSEGVCRRRSISTARYSTIPEPGSPYTEDDLRSIRQRQYYLPRILEGLLRGEQVSLLDEVALQKFAFDCPGAYTREQLTVVEDFARAWCEELCRFPHPYHPRHHGLQWVLEMLWTAGLDLTGQLCAIWQASAECVPAVRNYLGLYEFLLPIEVRLSQAAPERQGGRSEQDNGAVARNEAPASTSSSEEPDAPNEQAYSEDFFLNELATWAFNPKVQDVFTVSLETILLEGAEDPEETQEWEAWYFYLSGT